MKFKTLELQIKAVDAEQRIVEGYASVFGVLDSDREIMEPGAFDKTLGKRIIKLRYMHEVPIGKVVEYNVDAKGLFVKAYISKTQTGEEVLILAKDGVLAFSIGYRERDGYGAPDGWHITEAELYETSLVDLPSNESATLTAIKSAQERKSEEFTALQVTVDTAMDMHASLKEGRSLDSAERQLIVKARDSLQALLDASEQAEKRIAESIYEKLRR